MKLATIVLMGIALLGSLVPLNANGPGRPWEGGYSLYGWVSLERRWCQRHLQVVPPHGWGAWRGHAQWRRGQEAPNPGNWARELPLSYDSRQTPCH
jgi:hypothetical protein